MTNALYSAARLLRKKGVKSRKWLDVSFRSKCNWVSQGVTQNVVRVNLPKRNYPGQIVHCELASLNPYEIVVRIQISYRRVLASIIHRLHSSKKGCYLCILSQHNSFFRRNYVNRFLS